MGMSTKELQDFFWKYARGKGLPEKATAGAMGNISAECDWDPTQVEEGSGIGFGLFQWSYSRREQLEAYGTDIQHQCDFWWSEMTGKNRGTTGADLQWFNARGYTYSEYASDDYSPEESASAFCWCFERPNADYAHEDKRRSEARRFYDEYQGTGGGEDSEALVESAVTWMEQIANDNSHGYDQTNRWGPDYDCSSFIISAYQQAGIPVKDNGATYTGNMKSAFISSGFSLVDDWNGTDTNLKRGDVLLNEVHHTACYCRNGKIVQAGSNEFGGATGGQTGDQTGNEISIKDYYNYPWDYVLRYKNGASGGGSSVGEVWEKLITTPYNTKQLSNSQIDFIKTLSFGNIVKMDFTFIRNKKVVGHNFFGNRLTFDTLGYKIKDVRNDGLFVIEFNENKCPKYLNPKYAQGGSGF